MVEKGTPGSKRTRKHTSQDPSSVRPKAAGKPDRSERRLRAAIQKHSMWIACLSVLVTTVAALLQPRHPDPIPKTGLGRLQKLLYPMEFSNPRYLSERPWRKVWVAKAAPQATAPNPRRRASRGDEDTGEGRLVQAIVGSDILARSTDGGGKWRVTWFDPDYPLSSFWFSEDGSTGWCVGGGYRVTQDRDAGAGPTPGGHSFGVVLSTKDGGKTWKRLGRTPVASGGAVETPPALDECCLNAVWFVDANAGWLAGYYARDVTLDQKSDSADAGARSFLAKTTDGGQTWTEVVLSAVQPAPIPKPDATAAQRNESSFPHPDRSQTWTSFASAPVVAPSWIGAAPPDTNDKGNEPSLGQSAAQMPIPPDPDKGNKPSPKEDTAQMARPPSAAPRVETIDFTHACIDCVSFVNAQTGYVAGTRDTTAFVLATHDGGATWREILSLENYAAKTVYGTAGAQAAVWAIYTNEPGSARSHREQALVTHAQAPGESTPKSLILQGSLQSVGTSAEWPAQLQCIASGDGRRVWMAGSLNSTALLLEPDAHRQWTIPGARTIHSLHFTDPNLIFLVGETREGKGFQGTGRYDATGAVRFAVAPLKSTLRMPAFWYYLALLATVGLLVWAYFDEKKQEEKEDHSDEAKEIYVSDDPIASEDEDMFNFAPLARGVSKFLRNESTKPPLTLAILAPWGGGKSSLLKLIEADLREYDFQPVWVNAWHHPKEEDFLAALLEHLRLKAVPSMWNPRGWAFRVALIAIRTRRQWPLVFFLLAFLLTTYLVAPTGAGPGDSFDWRNLLPTALLGGGLAASLAALWRASSAFGITRDLLFGTLASLVRIRSPVKSTGFRHAFAIQFDDFARALQWSRHTRPVIIIDDLDRCQPSHVLNVLESVNFLSGCGQGFVLLGLDVDRVKVCIAEAYKASIKDPNAINPDFVEGYLQKIINVRIRVPDIKPDEFEHLVRSRRRERHWLFSLPRALPRYIPNLTAAVLIGALGSYGLLALRLLEPARQTITDLRPATANLNITPVGRLVPPAAPVLAVQGQESGATIPPPPPQTGARPNGVLRWAVSLLVWTGLLSFVAFLAVNHFFGRQLAKRKEALLEDSPRFREALGAWLPMLRRLKRDTETPRSLKRFINETRFIVMRNKADKSGRDVTGPTQCPSNWLVALHAVAWFHEPILSDGAFWTTTVPRFCHDPAGAMKSVKKKIEDLRQTLAQMQTTAHPASKANGTQELREPSHDEKAIENRLMSLEHQKTLLGKILEQSSHPPCRWFPDVTASELGVYRSRYFELREMAEFAGGPSETATEAPAP